MSAIVESLRRENIELQLRNERLDKDISNRDKIIRVMQERECLLENKVRFANSQNTVHFIAQKSYKELREEWAKLRREINEIEDFIRSCDKQFKECNRPDWAPYAVIWRSRDIRASASYPVDDDKGEHYNDIVNEIANFNKYLVFIRNLYARIKGKFFYTLQEDFLK